MERKMSINRYDYDKRKINDLYCQINPKTGRPYTSREIVKILGYGNASGLTCWLRRHKNRLVSFWLNEHEIKLARELFG